ncbi:hypothetical protein ACKKBF_B37045 [Auxenochlorella protothecoides x Auxenochlorella symbiontica]
MATFKRIVPPSTLYSGLSAWGALSAPRACSVRSVHWNGGVPLRRSRGCDKPKPHKQGVSIRAYKPTEKLQDWRVQQMVDHVKKYYNDFLTRGKEALASQLFDDDVVHKDLVWDPAHPTVGVHGMQHYLHDLRTAFPDFTIEIDQIATCDMNSLMVQYSGTATGLGEYHSHKPSHHVSAFSGINLVRFNHDRSKIVEIQVYRSAFAEDRLELGERELHGEGGFRELRLRRLV